MSEVNAQGFSITPLQDRLAALVAKMQGIFGSDINVDPNTYDGQTLGIFAEALADLDQLAQAVYNSFNPNTASGAALRTLVALNYLIPLEGAPSTVMLTFTGSNQTFIPSGFLVQSTDGSNNIWETTEDATIPPTGSINVQSQCTAIGPATAVIGAITRILSPLFGVASVTNNQEAVPGQFEETDEQLRVRRANSVANNAQGPTDAIRGSLRQLAGVTAAKVYENNTDNVDANGQAARSIYAIVLGGANQDIWNTIWFKRAATVKILGSITGNVIDTAGWPHVMAFDRPTQTPIYVVLNLKQRAGFPVTGPDLISAAIVAFAQSQFSIGDSVIQSELYAPIMTAIQNTGSILSLFIGTAPNPNTTTDIAIAYNAIAEFDPSFITVNLTS